MNGLETTTRLESAVRTSKRRVKSSGSRPRHEVTLRNWITGQPVNLFRHASELGLFTREQFGSGAEAPSEVHIKAVNNMLATLRKPLFGQARVLARVAAAASVDRPALLQRTVTLKERGHSGVMALEQVWDFYNELFAQRRREEGAMLLACDRIAQDCYQYVYLGLGMAKSIPTPPPFSYMRTGFSPATYRRGIPLTKLGRRINPFPLIQLPFHRLVNPWTLGAVLHEVSHNIQNDVGLAQAIPARIIQALTTAGFPPAVARTWARWNREMFADMCGLFLGGPTIVGSLMDVVGRSPRATYFFLAGKPHPIPYIRVLINTAQLHQMGFQQDAAAYEQAWKSIYVNPEAGNMPPTVLETVDQARKVVVDAVCFRPFKELGGKSLSEVIRFEPKEQVMIEEAGARLAASTDPGIIPSRFLIGAARIAFLRKHAPAAKVSESFYRELIRR